jgi:tRNA 2-thiouridine synthesizing protein A
MSMMPDKTLDTKGLACPLPILKTRKALSELSKGARLEVLATDPGSVPDFTAFCETTGHRLLEKSEAGGVYRFVIEHA